ncbi:Transcription factor CBF/NF-Y/archaeal histone [Kalmanozyma brasiliensis GHG001]|uniref:DNA polymerase epsilon subunit D n=1 Tax=Kalmanozyma brasiliensis (strain GHG001) TaxID=1365824 RepID=V5ESQ3_KALBG|nr:Transcription factor CBF/NF-Y/archaeal histone [Kalmanozyma brasiliensis GHG001]EST04969.1 Transcription factor CBF/NF-Y/archaeal histone [Kalmanozyma brasiliensis GHG001]
MPRKSTGAASSASAPGTPAAKTGGRKSISGSIDDTSSNAPLVVPPSSKAVLKQQEVALKGIESFELPRSNIVRCAKSELPDSVALRKDTQQALVRSATVWISYLTSIAHDSVREKGGKIISAQHVLDAVREAGFTEEEVGLLKEGLRGYRDAVQKKKAAAVVGKKGDAEVEGEEAEGNEADESRVDDAIAGDETLANDEDADELMDED